MHRKKGKKIVGLLLIGLFLCANYSPWALALRDIPDEIVLLEGDTAFILALPSGLTATGENVAVSSQYGERLSDVTDGITVQSQDESQGELLVSMFGIPVKRVTVRIVPEQWLVPGGHSIGVTLYTKGALVVGISEIIHEDGTSESPASNAGLMAGDIILEAQGIEIKNALHLTQIINEQKGKPVDLIVDRKGRRFTSTLTPSLDEQDGVYRLGMWVRDSTAGVGTLTYYNPKDQAFGALGHGIADLDTSQYLTIREGEVFYSQIVDILIGEKGQPGELRGIFSDGSEKFGRLKNNNEFGIFGSTYAGVKNPIYPALPIGTRSMVTEGPATILTTLDDSGIREFRCEIQKINRQSVPEVKSMIIHITDQELLSRTGGIVQGMSGSPIIQNGHIVGVITHVFINDPTRGYGLFIEWMLEKTNDMPSQLAA